MQSEKVIIIGAGPCGMSTGIELKRKGFDPLLIEKENVANSLYHYPTHQTFFSSSEKLEIGQIPFISERQKPVRNEALTYYRTVAQRTELRINTYEQVMKIEKQQNNAYTLQTKTKNGEEKTYYANYVVIATGYYDNPNRLNVRGESLPHVFHYFKEAHPYFNQNVVVIGGKNSAVDAALELEKAGAHVTVLYRGSDYSPSVKPWVLPNFESLVRHRKVRMEFDAEVDEITTESVRYSVKGEQREVKANFVFAMIGYHPNQQFLKSVGIEIDHETGRPQFREQSMETNIDHIYISGVIAAGYNNNEIFIENGRHHGEKIANDIVNKETR
ncbi:YpdA family putative bacillithiol disulfide reductase [Alkalibacillus haloalkaliphilus]|uniref:YpdA family putative bacillithiol disulfide reductase n=1 Tax=Alkalibacillus haloalkaliphilus TaxID=94136 RepID=UPI0029358ABB|nr:YpdA family putative bacillithiol disulfide reductase [Alkalibacillus haloalkaliphilus]MDV2580846.1 YpdA family putative bacillithiol disulfide reductase [Alkalibacillus haloalkaliphilus]